MFIRRCVLILVTLSLLILLVPACGGGDDGDEATPTSTTTQTQAEVVVRAWNEAFSNQDVDAALELMSDDFVRYGDSTNWQPIPKALWGQVMKGFFVAFPDWTWELTSLTAEGDLVVCEFTEHGTFTEPYPIMPGLTIQPTGESFTDYDADFFQVNEEGLITEIRAYVTNDIDRKFHLASQVEEYMAGQ